MWTHRFGCIEREFARCRGGSRGPNQTEELKLFLDEDVDGQWETWVQPYEGSARYVGVAVRVDKGKFGTCE